MQTNLSALKEVLFTCDFFHIHNRVFSVDISEIRCYAEYREWIWVMSSCSSISNMHKTNVNILFKEERLH